MGGIHDGHRDRMRQQYKQAGIEAFQPHQILEMLLFYAVPRKDTNELAHRLMEVYHTLPDVIAAPYDALCAIRGVTPNVALFFQLLKDMARLYGQAAETEQLSTSAQPERLRAFITSQLRSSADERVFLLCLDSKQRLLFSDFVGEGNVHATEVNVRKIVKIALDNKATTVILSHNHPVGLARPSAEDHHATQVLGMALASVGVTLLDHYIVSENDCLSMHGLPDGHHWFDRFADAAAKYTSMPPSIGDARL